MSKEEKKLQDILYNYDVYELASGFIGVPKGQKLPKWKSKKDEKGRTYYVSE